ncbi:MAG: hypothetical protein ACK5X3_18275, partial [Pseudomonadota bacterium]
MTPGPGRGVAEEELDRFAREAGGPQVRPGGAAEEVRAAGAAGTFDGLPVTGRGEPVGAGGGEPGEGFGAEHDIT